MRQFNACFDFPLRVNSPSRRPLVARKSGEGVLNVKGKAMDKQVIEAPEMMASSQAFSSSDKKRLAARIGTRWFLQSLAIARSFGGGDILDGLILLAITDANTRYLNTPQAGFYRVEDIPPDDVRQPVSVYQIARDLGLSYETARRHVQQLIKAGKIERKADGIIVPARLFAERENLGLTGKSYRNLQALVDQMKEIEAI